jgi:hypothetical protein
MKNALIGILCVFAFTLILLLLQHLVLIVGRQRARTHGVYIISPCKAEKGVPTVSDPPGAEARPPDKFNFSTDRLSHGDD